MNRIRSQGLLSARLRRTPLAIWIRLYAEGMEGQASEELQTADCLLSQSPLRSTMKSVALPLAFCNLHFAISHRRLRFMCHRAFAVILAAVFAFCPMVSVQAAEKSREPLVERVHKAIEAAVRFLR